MWNIYIRKKLFFFNWLISTAGLYNTQVEVSLDVSVGDQSLFWLFWGGLLCSWWVTYLLTWSEQSRKSVCVFVNHNDRVAVPRGMIGGVGGSRLWRKLFEPRMCWKTAGSINSSATAVYILYKCVNVHLCVCRIFCLQNYTCTAGCARTVHDWHNTYAYLSPQSPLFLDTQYL